ncbi:CtsR family transcriptional regulator [Enterococcus sp. CSURQ0835]|uniref:CtsR family transcriptional regulator n=1 Tax=Enterococcus sp. CSURQ0835 TaxID=2681394 RepID=UPI00135A447D|nr:CtsR family transcriptional regulator [Enterococcus sp. CSURQ0835]
MSSRNTSDLIESYLKGILEDHEIIEIRRAEMAQLFNCVPSQINYVINTRFTFQRGYLVESKRGGGGYIRISKVKISDQHYFLEQLMDSFEDEMSEANAFGIIQKLFEEKIITENEGNLMLSAVSKNSLGISQIENRLRSRILHGFLERLSYEKRSEK